MILSTQQGTCQTGLLVGSQAGEPCTRWQREDKPDRPWRTTSHYIRSGSAPLIGARLGISSVVPSSLETFFWATAQMSALSHAPMPHAPCRAMLPCHACAVWVRSWVGCWGFPQ